MRIAVEWLGADLATIRRIVRDDPVALDLLDRETVRRPGGDHRSEEARINTDNVRVDPEPEHGNQRQYALRRLRKSRPDLHARVLAGECSAHAAMVEAGFRRKTVTVDATDPQRAARQLARVFDDDTLREIELDENTVRLDLTEYEASKTKLRQIQAAEQEIAEEKARRGDALSTGRGHKGGNREASRRTGLSEPEVRRTKRHVSAAEAHPIFQGPQWKRSHVLAAPGDRYGLNTSPNEVARRLKDVEPVGAHGQHGRGRPKDRGSARTSIKRGDNANYHLARLKRAAETDPAAADVLVRVATPPRVARHGQALRVGPPRERRSWAILRRHPEGLPGGAGYARRLARAPLRSR